MTDIPKRPLDGEAQKHYREIVDTQRVETLQKALKNADTAEPADKTLLIDALEDYCTRNLLGQVQSAEEWDEIEQYLEVSHQLSGGAPQGDAFGMHKLLMIADKVADEKGDKTASVLKDLLAGAAKLSNSEYHSHMPLARLFIDAARKHTPSQKDLDAKPNPFRKKYGGPKN